MDIQMERDMARLKNDQMHGCVHEKMGQKMGVYMNV